MRTQAVIQSSALVLLLAAIAACSSSDSAEAAAAGGDDAAVTPAPPGPSGDADLDPNDASPISEDAGSGDASIHDAALDAHDAADAAKPGQLYFESNFESGNLTKWTAVEYCHDQPTVKRVEVYSSASLPAGAPAPRLGTHALHFHVLDTDVAPCTTTDNPRAQLESPDLFVPGDERWEAWSVYVPTDFPALPNIPGNYVVLQEDYGAPYGVPPNIGWDILNVGGASTFSTGNSGQTVSSTALIKGRWIDYLVHKQFANSKTTGGFVEGWIDKKPVTFPSCSCTKLMTQTMITGAPSARFFINSYRMKGMFAAADLYFDEVRVGSTRAVVELP